jgi:hypothetical protein
MKVVFKGKRIDNGEWVEGYYFVSPLTDENSGTPPEAGWFFLSGERRHCISTENGVVFIVEENSVDLIEIISKRVVISKNNVTIKN